MCDKEFMWALKNGDLDEVKDYVAKVSGASLRGCCGGVSGRGAQGVGGTGSWASLGGDSWTPQGLDLGGPSVPGNRCVVAKAAVACLSPAGNGRLGCLPRSARAVPLIPQVLQSLNEAFLHLGLSPGS